MLVQRHMLDVWLTQIVPHPAAGAYREGVSVVDGAIQHLRADTVIRLDIASFFTSIRERALYKALRAAHWRWSNDQDPRRLSPLAAYQFAVLFTAIDSGSWLNRGTGGLVRDGVWTERQYPYRRMREGYLPQGAPSSGALANFVMRPADEEIYRHASRLGLRYTRYSDDLYFSSRREVPHHVVNSLVKTVRGVLSLHGLHLNDAKTRVSRRGARRSVLGILVDGPVPRLPRERHREIELHLRGVDRSGLEGHARERNFSSVDALTDHVSGLIAWARQVEPVKGQLQWDHWIRSQWRSQNGQSAQSQAPGLQTTTNEARESIDRLLDQGRVYRSSREYAEFITFVGSFRQYSPFNAAMVRLQKPGARFVLTDAKWRSSYGRVCRPGAQPLVIMRPKGPYMVVYDVSDTEALPGAPSLPREVTHPNAATSRLDEGKIMRLWDITVDNAKRDGIRVHLVGNAPHHAGSAGMSRWLGEMVRPGKKLRDPSRRYRIYHEVEVSQHLEVLDRYVTLLHELAHIYCGHLGALGPDAWWLDRPGSETRDEVEAETVAFIVLRRWDPGAVMPDYLLNYISAHSEVPPDVSVRTMMTVAKEILEMGKQRLQDRSDRQHSSP